ncbi:hypothetical protein KA977_13935, partial [Candidatus Dependentiae bacterium]|nr:hypothetical protein [Candidatus Dependentiae bacterium]
MTPYFLFIVINILTLLLIISNKSLYLVSCFCILFFLILLIIKKNNNFFSKKLLFLFVPSAFVFGSGIFFDESDKWHYTGLKLLIILLLQNYF